MWDSKRSFESKNKKAIRLTESLFSKFASSTIDCSPSLAVGSGETIDFHIFPELSDLLIEDFLHRFLAIFDKRLIQHAGSRRSTYSIYPQ